MYNTLQSARDIITLLSEKPGVSGYEHNLKPILESIFHSSDTNLTSDFFGNCYIQKKGISSNQLIMLTAHIDEIGLIITHIDQRGFLHFSTVGGIDDRTLLHQEVLVHGKEDYNGIISLIPSQANSNKDRKDTIKSANLIIDIGYSQEKAKTIIQPGDIVSIKRTPLFILNERVVGKALDDRAGIVVLAICFNELNQIKHKHNVVFVSTVQEEVGLRGAITSSKRIKPDLAVAVDVTHAQTLDTKYQVSINLGKGPTIALGPNVHPEIFSRLVSSAKENRIPYQLQPIAGPTGTDARVIQLTGSGIPTGLISVPLRYMHTSVEMASLKDIIECGKLLAYFISSLPENLEDLSCF